MVNGKRLSSASATAICQCIQEGASTGLGAVQDLCRIAKLHPSQYYRWLERKGHPRKPTQYEDENQLFADWLMQKREQLARDKVPIPGYRQTAMLFCKETGIRISLKRAYRICDQYKIKGTTKKRKKKYTRCTPEMTAENLMARDFNAARPNEKWSIDVTEMQDMYGSKWYVAGIVDMHDRYIVGYAISRHNDNPLVLPRWTPLWQPIREQRRCCRATEARNSPAVNSTRFSLLTASCTACPA